MQHYDITNRLVIDLETSVNNVGEDSVGEEKASPVHPDNHIIQVGSKSALDKEVTIFHPFFKKDEITLPPEGTLLIGHNIMFDLLYLMRDNEEFRWNMHKYPVWDTQMAEYIITMQLHQWSKLDQLSAKYGGTQKIDVIKEMWDKGVRTEYMDQDLLETYLVDDVKNTELVFLNQVKLIEDNNYESVLYTSCEALKARTEMKFNGMELDVSLIPKYKEREVAELQKSLDLLVPLMQTQIKEVEINPLSLTQVSAFLFGGKLKYKKRVPKYEEDGITPKRYSASAKKAGQIMSRLEDTWEVITGRYRGKIPAHWKSDKTGKNKTGRDVLEELTTKVKDKEIYDFCVAVLNARKKSKDINTYYDGLGKLVWPNTGRIYGKVNGCGTITGRFSSSSPNLQNVPGKNT